MNKSVIKVLKIAIPIALGVFLIMYSYNKFSQEQLQSIKQYFKSANYGFVILSVLLGFLSHISRAKRWLYMFEPLGYKPKLPNSIMAVGIAYLMNMGVPRSGELARAYVLQKHENIPFDKAFGTIIAERIADLVILLLLVLAAVLAQTDIILAFLDDNLNVLNLIWFASIGGLLVLVSFWILKTVKLPILKKIKVFVEGLKEGALSILKLKKIGPFILHTLFIWTMYVLMFYLCTLALPETQNISLSALLLGFVVGSFTIAFTNSGFGSYPFIIASVFLLFGISDTVGTAFGWIVWIAQFTMILIFGGLSFLILPFYNQSKKV